MTNLPPTWPRYFRASIAKHFVQPGEVWYLEGDEIDLATSHYEIRLFGPEWDQINKDQWQIDFTVNVAIVAQKTENLYTLDDMIGIVAARFGPIPINKFESNPSLLTCARLVSRIKINRFGDLDIGKDPIRVTAATVQADFHGEINGSD